MWGQGAILGNAEDELIKSVEKSGIPAAWTILGASAIPTSHPLNVGMLGMHGNYAPNVLTNECDVLIAIGMRFDDRVTGDVNRYAKQAKIIHFEIDPAEVNKNIKVDIAVLGDAKKSLKEISKITNKKTHKKWLNEFKKLYKIEYEKVIHNDLNPVKDGLTMGEVMKEINLQTKGNAAIVSDVGQHQMIACRYSDFNISKSNITSGGLGTMGFALPAAIGAKMACPEREVVAVIGDGGYQMTIQELGTVFQTKAAVKIVVLNNFSLKIRFRGNRYVYYSCFSYLIHDVNDSICRRFFISLNDDRPLRIFCNHSNYICFYLSYINSSAIHIYFTSGAYCNKDRSIFSNLSSF